METLRDAVRMRVFIGETDRSAGHTLYRAIVQAALRAGLAGATALRGPLSYGHSRRLNFEFIVEAPGNLPMVVEIIDVEDRIQAFLPQLDKLIGSGLVTLGKLRMVRVGRLTMGGQAWSPQYGGYDEEDLKMEVPHEALLLRIFTGADDRYEVEQPLYIAIVMKAREMHLAGATVLKGLIGYGQSTHLHQQHLFAGDERPVVIEICDAEEKINAFLPVLDDMMESGLVTLERAQVLQYRRKRSPYIERLKKSIRQRLHVGDVTTSASSAAGKEPGSVPN
ncbi:MAG: DUF190 domain-containing protein [Rhodomicrobium sp.]